MRLGLALPNVGPLGSRSNIIAYAQEAERLGYNSLWVTERLLYPTQPRQGFGGGAVWPDVYKSSLDPLDTLIFAAGVTEKIRLGTSVLDLPFYSPAPLAKRIATLDVLSGGRAVLGGGLGWSEDESIAYGAPFDQRSGRMAEMLRALIALWGPDPVEFHGKYFDVAQTLFSPKPLQKPRPPIVLAGGVPAALARAAKYADGFNPVAGPDPARFEQWLAGAQAAWKEAGRAAPPEIVVRVNHGFLTSQPIDRERQFLTGSVEQVRADIAQLGQWGVTEVFFSFTAYANQPGDFDKLIDQAHRLRGAV